MKLLVTLYETLLILNDNPTSKGTSFNEPINTVTYLHAYVHTYMHVINTYKVRPDVHLSFGGVSYVNYLTNKLIHHILNTYQAQFLPCAALYIKYSVEQTSIKNTNNKIL